MDEEQLYKLNADTPEGDDELISFGYIPQLHRSMGGFSSFAVSFSLISVLTGIYANFNFGFAQIGGSIVWSWLLVGIGQFFVALVMADLANQYPIAGYGYQWSARLTNPHAGFFVGWFLLIQFATGFPGTCQALAITLSSMLDGPSVGPLVSYITLGVIAVVTVLHLTGIRLAALVNDLGVYAEIAGVVVIVTTLMAVWIASGSVNGALLFSSLNAATGDNAGFSAFALSLLLGAWCLTGFEAAADLAEETKSPRSHIPRAVIISQVSATAAGFFFLLFLILSCNNISTAQQSENSLHLLLENAIGKRATAATGLLVMISIFACAVASMAAATRLVFSMARDNMLPFSGSLSRVDTKHQTPVIATLLIWGVSSLLIVFVQRLEVITSVGAVAAYIGYTGILLSALTSTKPRRSISGYSMGKYQKGIQCTALIWTCMVVLALTIPETHIPGVKLTHLPALMAGLVGLVGVHIYLFYVRHRIFEGKAGPPHEKM